MTIPGAINSPYYGPFSGECCESQKGFCGGGLVIGSSIAAMDNLMGIYNNYWDRFCSS